MAERILLVDDHPLTREALGALLSQHGFDVVGEASDGLEALELAEELRPQLILLDPMPELDVLSALPRLREILARLGGRRANRPGHGGQPAAAIRGGAAGYLLKSEPPGRIVDFHRVAASPTAPALSGSVARGCSTRCARPPRRRGTGSIAKRLWLRGRGAAPAGRDLSMDDIAKRLLISEHTVRSHVKSLLRKLGVSSRREAPRAARGQLAPARNASTRPGSVSRSNCPSSTAATCGAEGTEAGRACGSRVTQP